MSSLYQPIEYILLPFSELFVFFLGHFVGQRWYFSRYAHYYLPHSSFGMSPERLRRNSRPLAWASHLTVIVHAKIHDGTLRIREIANPFQVFVFPDTFEFNIQTFFWSYLAHIIYKVLVLYIIVIYPCQAFWVVLPTASNSSLFFNIYISLLVIPTVIFVDDIYERLQIGNITLKCMILIILFVVTS